MIRPAAVLLDIEGTTTPIAFVHDVLFAHAAARLADFCAANADDPVLDEVRAATGDGDVVAVLRAWMAADAKIPALKTIQGRIWAAGYDRGEIRGAVYPDVPPALRSWAKAGLRLFVYSSGSVEAQKRLFQHSTAGDLSGWFQGFFDTSVGPKRAAASYAAICRGVNVQAFELLFLSDATAELDAAAAAGLLTCQIVRPADGTAAGSGHAVAADFGEVAALFGLPRAA